MILRKPITTPPFRLQATMLKVSGYDLKVEYQERTKASQTPTAVHVYMSHHRRNKRYK